MHHPFEKEVKSARTPAYPVDPLIINRWSPRAMTGDEMEDQELLRLFEAARWAPSSYNNQPWRFLYCKRNTPEWALFFDLLIDFNKSWCKDASALVVVISAKNFEHNGKPCQTHSFDTGAAWMALALEASSLGYVAHGMQGFDYERAKKNLEIPDEYQVEAMIAIGKHAPKENLSSELQQREAPSVRKPLQELVMKGKFKKN